MKIIKETPTITAGAYASLDAVGGKLEFEDACTPFNNSGTIVQAYLSDKGKQDAHLYLVLFSEDFTETADNAAFAVSDADLLNVIAVIEFVAAEYIDFNANSFVQNLDDFEFNLVEGGTSLFGQLFVETSTPTYTSTSDLSAGLIIE